MAIFEQKRNVCNVRVGNFRIAPHEDPDGPECEERAANFMSRVATAFAADKVPTGKQLQALRDDLYKEERETIKYVQAGVVSKRPAAAMPQESQHQQGHPRACKQQKDKDCSKCDSESVQKHLEQCTHNEVVTTSEHSKPRKPAASRSHEATPCNE
jgi:hypothetical protein